MEKDYEKIRKKIDFHKLDKQSWYQTILFIKWVQKTSI